MKRLKYGRPIKREHVEILINKDVFYKIDSQWHKMKEGGALELVKDEYHIEVFEIALDEGLSK